MTQTLSSVSAATPTASPSKAEFPMENAFYTHFHTPPQWQSSAPGRINLIGEHTDYNQGFVMPGAIEQRMTFLLAKNGSPDQVRVVAMDVGEARMEVSLNDIRRQESDGWQNYILGVIGELQQSGHQLGGFDALFWGNVPLGAGLSSSAALECALATGLNALFALGLDRATLAYTAQRAEQNYAGVACGIMDQYASMMGRKGHFFRLDCRSMEHAYFPFASDTYQLLLLDTQVKHSLVDSGYNDRRAACQEAVYLLQQKNPEVQSLRDVSKEILYRNRSLLPDKIFYRAFHVVTENARVAAATHALEAGDMAELGKLLYQSHESLSHMYEVSCPELDFLVDFTRNKPEVAGARMVGGGFGGCTLNLVEKSHLASFVGEAAVAYKHTFGIALKAYRVSLDEGASAQPIA